MNTTAGPANYFVLYWFLQKSEPEAEAYVLVHRVQSQGIRRVGKRGMSQERKSQYKGTLLSQSPLDVKSN